MLKAAGVASRASAFLPEFARCIDLFLGLWWLWGKGTLLMQERALVTAFAIPLQEVIADTFGARRSTLLGR